MQALCDFQNIDYDFYKASENSSASQWYSQDTASSSTLPEHSTFVGHLQTQQSNVGEVRVVSK